MQFIISFNSPLDSHNRDFLFIQRILLVGRFEGIVLNGRQALTPGHWILLATLWKISVFRESLHSEKSHKGAAEFGRDDGVDDGIGGAVGEHHDVAAEERDPCVREARHLGESEQESEDGERQHGYEEHDHHRCEDA